MPEMNTLTEPPFFSIVIPAHNEEDVIEKTCVSIIAEFTAQGIDDIEILVVNDNSSDGTEAILRRLCDRYPCMRYLNNTPPHGFGFAVRKGLENFRGEAVAVVMADLSDSPQDIVVYYHKIREGFECVFGSRFIKGSKVIDYPAFKLTINRVANWFVKTMFGLKYNDVTNAFKAYRREVIEGVHPILSHHFNLTVELPLKAIVRGYSFVVVPISWTNREAGVSKLKLREMGSRYLFIVLYVYLERLLSKGDYHRTMHEKQMAARLKAGDALAPVRPRGADSSTENTLNR
jgi:dolichol-phosphate mannosyltransferase